MATTIITKYGSGAPAASDVVRGELAVDTENGRLYTETSGGAVIEIGLNPSGNVDVTGTVTADGLTVDGNATISVSDNSDNLTLISTDTDANAGPNLLFKRDNNSAAGDDLMGSIVFQGEDAGNNLTDYVAFKTQIQDPTGGSEDGRLKIELMSGGTSRSLLDASGSNAIVFNEDGQALNFRVESSGNANMLFVDGTNDRVGIGTDSPSTTLTVAGTGDSETGVTATHSRSGVGYTLLLNNTNNGANKGSGIKWQGGGFDTAAIIGRSDATAASADAPGYLTFHTSNDGSEDLAERMRIDSSGNVGINNSNPSAYGKFVVDGTGNILNVNATSGSALLQLYEGGAGRFGIETLNGSAGAKFTTAGTERMRIDSSGAVSVGYTGDISNVTSGINFTAGIYAMLNSNNYLGSGTFGANCILSDATTDSWKYIATNSASRVYHRDAVIKFDRAASGTGGTALTWSESMRIDASGNLLVGTTDTTLYNNTSGGGFHAAANGFTEVAYESANAADPAFLVNNTGSDGDIIQLRKDGATVGSIGVTSGDLTIGTGDTGLAFLDGGNFIQPHNITTNARRDAAVDLGTTSGRFKDLYLSGRVVANGVTTSAHAWSSESDSTSSSAHLYFRNPNGFVGNISTSGTATAYNTSSDYRLKENVVAMSGATERLKQLAPKRFNFIADADTTVDGFLAHEVAEVIPEAVTGAKDAVDNDGNAVYQGIDQSKLVPLLVATIQELEARIAQLEGAN